MLKISKFTCENLISGCVTDERAPRFSFAFESDRENSSISQAVLQVNGWQKITDLQIAVPYEGSPLKAFTKYRAVLKGKDNSGETAEAEIEFETGRFDTPWKAEWISDSTYQFTEKKVSPVPMMFRKTFTIKKKIKSAKIYATAMGIYELMLNQKKVGNEFFAPGFTSYQSYLQYQTYDVTKMLQDQNELTAVVGGGWAVGSFVFTRKNRVSADLQALLLELRLLYEDGSEEIIGSDSSFDVTEEGPYRLADFYDGESFDATIDTAAVTWKKASAEKLKISPKLLAGYGMPVQAQETMNPVSCRTNGNELIYDFGQNFAGVVCISVQGRRGQEIIIKHAEILHPDGSLNTKFLRTAKAEVHYVCREGYQTYMPRLTYMGFRYISVKGAAEKDITISARALYSGLTATGSFTCSDQKLNQLNSNILWSAKSNFVDIPTDCPQRDERMGWTGDIAVFAPTACYNFDMSRFLDKWLMDVMAEQKSTGGIPNTVPAQGYGFPATMPVLAVDFWGDASVLVPYAEYMARGDISILKKYYKMMKKYVNACRFWAGLFGFGHKRYIWHTPHSLHFGDWVAPDVPKMQQWQKRSKWTATASLKNTSSQLAKIAEILGEYEDAGRYREVSEKVSAAYQKEFTDGHGKLKSEFQTGYVLPIYYNMFDEKQRLDAVKNLARLVKDADYCIGTGFPGTPYILFALADNGQEETAYRMLQNTKAPSWLYEVEMGATTIWERWDGLDTDGNCPISNDGTDNMISYNHYASGAVGAFLYTRIAGIYPIEPGYKRFAIAPVLGGGLTYAAGSVETPFGKVISDWKIKDGRFEITVKVPFGTVCELKLPDGRKEELFSGSYTFYAKITS